MGTGSNNPETTPATPAAAQSYDLSTPQGRAQVPTQITIQGRQFELRNATVAQMQELYGLLSADDQARTQGLAGFIQNFRAPLMSELPAELQQPGRIEAFVSELQNNAGRVSENAPEWMRNVFNGATNAAGNMPGAEHVRSIIGAVQGAGSAVSGTVSAVGEARDWVMLLPRATEYLITRGREAWNSSGSPATAEQAMAMATAYQGSLVASRREAGFFDQAGARVEQAWSWLSNSAIGQYVGAFFDAVGSMVSGNGWNFSESLAARQAVQVQPRSYEQILNENLEQPVQATSRLRNAERVADRPTAGVADTLEAASTNGSALWTDHNNNINAMNESRQSAPVNNPQTGQPLNMGDVNAQRQQEIFGSIGQNGLAVGAAGLTMGAIIPGRYIAQGFARGRVTNHENRAARLETRDADLDRRINAARGAGNDAEVNRLSAERERVANRWAQETETAETRRANAGRFTQRALDQVDEVNPTRGPRLPGGRILQNLGEESHNLLSGARNVAPAARELATVAPAATTAAASSTWTRLRSVVSGLRGMGTSRGARVAGGAFAGLGVLGLIAAPVDSAMAATEATNDADRGDRSTDAVVQGGGAIAAVTTIARVGLTRSTPFLSPIIETANFGSAVARGDNHGMVASGGRLATIATFTGGGAGLGLLGGPFAPITSTAGAVGGAIIGGLVVGADYIWSALTGSESVYDSAANSLVGPTQTPTEIAASRSGSLGPTEPGIASSLIEQAQANARTVFANVQNVRHQNGETVTLADASPTGMNFGRPGNVSLPPLVVG